MVVLMVAEPNWDPVPSPEDITLMGTRLAFDLVQIWLTLKWIYLRCATFNTQGILDVNRTTRTLAPENLCVLIQSWRWPGLNIGTWFISRV